MKYSTFHFFPILLISLLFNSCIQKATEEKGNLNLDEFQLTEIQSPVKSGGEPNLFVSEKGNVYLSWVEYENDSTDVLMFSKMENNQWSNPKEIARGSDWFVNWADFPSLVVYKNNEQHLAAHWLQKRAAGTYDYDIHISQSKDGGITWSSSFIIHTDGIAAEHGFVSLVPQDDGKIFAAWLDGRNTKLAHQDAPSKNDHHDHGGGGAMTLRTAIFDIEGNRFEEKELDHRICDCCQTATTITPERTLVAYRDRSIDEIRDISFIQKTNGTWSSPSLVHNDHWKIAGCPVNGPALANYNNDIAITWFSSPEEKPSVKTAFFDSKISKFKTPIRVDDGNPLGRTDIVLFKDFALVSWLEKTGEEAAIKIAQVYKNKEKVNKATISKTSTSRKSGFPQMEKTADKIIFAWTITNGKKSTIKTGYWNIKH